MNNYVSPPSNAVLAGPQHTGRWWVGWYIWYSEEGAAGRAAQPAQAPPIAAERYCLLHTVVQLNGQAVSEVWSTFLYDVRLRSYGASKLPIFRILAYFPHTKPLKRIPSGDQPTAQGLHRRMIPIFHVIDGGPNFQRGAFRHRKFPATSVRAARGAEDPKTCPNFRLWQIHTECNCTARQI